jgi:hypothetical protein
MNNKPDRTGTFKWEIFGGTWILRFYPKADPDIYVYGSPINMAEMVGDGPPYRYRWWDRVEMDWERASVPADNIEEARNAVMLIARIG